MASIYDVDPTELIGKAAEKLKKVPEIQPPEWAKYVKTGMHKQRQPVEADWWYMRSASVLRAVYRLIPGLAGSSSAEPSDLLSLRPSGSRISGRCR